MCRGSLHQSKLRRVSLFNPTLTTRKIQLSQTPEKQTVSEKLIIASRDKTVKKNDPVYANQSEATVLDLISIIGESSQDLSNATVEKYMNRDFLKISQQWSQTLSKDNGESDEEFTTSPHGMVMSLSEECARLEVSAVALLASMEYDMDKKCGKCASQNYNMSENECWMEEDDEMQEEILKLEEAMESLEEELNTSGRAFTVLENMNKTEAKREEYMNEHKMGWSIEVDMIDTNTYLAPCA